MIRFLFILLFVSFLSAQEAEQIRRENQKESVIVDSKTSQEIKDKEAKTEIEKILKNAQNKRSQLFKERF